MEEKPMVTAKEKPAAAELQTRAEGESAKASAVVSLRQIQEDVARQKKYAKAQLGLSVARTAMTAIVLAAVAVFLFVGVQRVQSTLARLDALMTELESVDLSGIDQSMEVLEQQGNSLTEAVTEKLNGALAEFDTLLDSMRGVDFAALQKSIADFKELVEPIRAFFGG
ncbi:MAG: hypothetical protein ABFC62_08095 [Clostridiaceae bacterium]